jgi:hypothetical protein
VRSSLVSICAAIAVSTSAEPIARRLSARSWWPRSSSSDTADPTAEAPKCTGSNVAFFDQTGIAVAPSSTPVYVERTSPVAAETISAASLTTLATTLPPVRCSTRSANVAATPAFENATSVHTPTDIGLWTLKTRSMLRKRSGRPRSEISSGGDATALAAAIHRACRTRSGSPPRRCATAAITAAAPDAPPTKKYAGTSQVQTGGFKAGRP